MCGADDPATVDEALAMLDRALAMLTTADAALLPAEVEARALRALERAEARHTAARARTLAAFSAQDGYEDDGHGSARVWLRWQTRVTKGAAAGAVGWMRRLAAHPVIAQALADGRSPRPGRGRSAAGASGWPATCATTPTRSWPEPRPPGRSSPTWPGWPSRYTSVRASSAPTATTMGSMTGALGWTSPSGGRGGWSAT